MPRLKNEPKVPNPDGLCMCGCGRPTPIAKRTRSTAGQWKGYPVPLLKGHKWAGRHPAEERFWKKVDRSNRDGCWPWTAGRFPSGYGAFSPQGRADSTARAHRYAYELAYGPIPEGLIVRHSCDNPACCNPAHLLLGTNADNSADMLKRRRVARGTRQGLAKLDYPRAQEIRRLHTQGAAQTALAEMFSVARSTISDVVRGVRWNEPD